MHTWLISCSRSSPLSLNSTVARNCRFCYHKKKKKKKHEKVKIDILFNDLFCYVSYPTLVSYFQQKPSTSKNGTSTKSGFEAKL